MLEFEKYRRKYHHFEKSQLVSHWRRVVVFSSLLALTGCSGNSYSSLYEIADVIVASNVGCADLKQDDLMGSPRGECVDNYGGTLTMIVWSSPEAREAQLNEYFDYTLSNGWACEDFAEDFSLEGSNWSILGNESTLDELKGPLGGKKVSAEDQCREWVKTAS